MTYEYLIPPGTYAARAVYHDLGESKNGRFQVAVTFEIVAGDYIGRRLTYFATFAPGRATEFAIKALRAAGWTCDDPTVLTGLGDAECDIVVEHDEYNGRIRDRIRFVNRPGERGAFTFKAPLSEEKRRAIAAQLRGTVIAVSRESGQPPQPAPQGQRRPAPMPAQRQAPAQAAPPPDFADDPGAEHQDDDIPF